MPFFGSKIVPINILMQKLGAEIIYLCQNMHFHQFLIVLKAFDRGVRFDPPPHVPTYPQKPM